MQSVAELIRKNYLQTFESVAVYRTTDDKLNRFVQAMFGHDYEFVADLEMNNDTSWTTSVGPKDTLGGSSLQNISEFIENGSYSRLAHQLMQYMYDKGMITEGEYIVEVCW